MKDTTVAAVQMNGEIGKTEKNLEKVEDWTSKASNSRADLVLFPELVITGHWCSPEAWSHAEKVPDGSSVRWLERIAREYGVVVCAGLGEIESGVQYNAQVVVGPDGYLGKQRKLHMSGDEYFYYPRLPDQPDRRREVHCRHRDMLRQPLPRGSQDPRPEGSRGHPSAPRS